MTETRRLLSVVIVSLIQLGIQQTGKGCWELLRSADPFSNCRPPSLSNLPVASYAFINIVASAGGLPYCVNALFCLHLRSNSIRGKSTSRNPLADT